MNVIEIKSRKDLSRLRRIALSSQGLLQTQPFGKGITGARKAIEQIGYVQIDTISVVERAHSHVLHSRVPNFKPAMIDGLLHAGDIFEYWSHAAAFLPMDDYRFSLPYKNAIKSGQVHWYREPDKKLMSELLARVRSDGPLRSRDVESNTEKRAGWWDWKPAKKALEQLYMEGDLMVCSREGFQKTYDLTERVLPAGVDTRPPSLDEFAEHLFESQLRCHGFVSLKGITYLRKNTGLRQAVKTLVNERLAQGALQQLQLDNGDSFLAKTETFEQRLPRVNDRLLILSPFDNAVIQRDRLKSIFNFDYQIECYVPAAKRQFGYFSLPLLYRDQFVGRMDCKAHRKARQLEIKALHLEPQNLENTDYVDVLIAAFVKAVTQFCHFQNCDSVVLSEMQPQRLFEPFSKALSNADFD